MTREDLEQRTVDRLPEPEVEWETPLPLADDVAQPGTRKSGIFHIVTAPIGAYERDVQPDERCVLTQWESRLRALETDLRLAETAARKISNDLTISDREATRMAAVEALESHRGKRPRITRIITDDATSEAVKSLLAEQGGAIAVMSAESAFLSITAGARYSDAPNLDVL